jgi:hypothetical protein
MPYLIKNVICLYLFQRNSMPHIKLHCPATEPKADVLRVVVKKIDSAPQTIPYPPQRMIVIGLIPILIQKLNNVFLVGNPNRTKGLTMCILHPAMSLPFPFLHRFLHLRRASVAVLTYRYRYRGLSANRLPKVEPNSQIFLSRGNKKDNQ